MRNLLNRREFASTTGKLVLGAGALAKAPLFAAHDTHSRETPDMLVNHVAKMVNTLAERWDAERARITTPASVEERNRFVRKKAIDLMHGFPERNPLSPIIVNVLPRDGYRIETLMFQSRPNFWVPGSLYIPTRSNGPFPGIISPCGHSANGRIASAYQSTYLNLVKSGFVVLAYDPIGQGERREHWNPQTQLNELPGPVTTEHMIEGQLLLLLGEDLTNYRIWDGMRAIDYLLTRPEVDPKRIGCTGQSGGGTLTMFISALDERVRCAASNEGGTGHRWPVHFRPESRLDTGDTEQHIFGAAVYGIDLCDLLVAVAPRPLLVTVENYNPRFNQAAEHIRQRYRQLGVPEKFATEQATDPHGMTVKLRLATTDWFCRWFYNRRGPATEPEFQLEDPETLYSTPNGSIRYARQGETIFSLMLKKQATLPPKRAIPGDARQFATYREQIQSDIRSLLHYKDTSGPLDVRETVTTPRKGYRIQKLEFLSEPGIYVPVWVFLPDGAMTSKTAILYINDAGASAAGLEFGVLEKLARKGRLVVAADVRGIGETKPSQPGDAETTLQYLLWEAGESLLGQRVQDVVRAVDYTLSRSDVEKTGVQVIGKGRGALWALYAAALDARIRSVVCDGLLLSYGHLAAVDRYATSVDTFVIDVLNHFDLPQVAAAVCGRNLTLLGPVDHMNKPADLSLARKVYGMTQETYAKAGAGSRFQIVPDGAAGEAAERYINLL